MSELLTGPLPDWVLRTTVEASLLALLVLAAQWVLGRRISARWRYNLWLLVVARLLLPGLPESRYSPFNVLWSPRPEKPTESVATASPVAPSRAAAPAPPLVARVEAATGAPTPDRTVSLPLPRPPKRDPLLDYRKTDAPARVAVPDRPPRATLNREHAPKVAAAVAVPIAQPPRATATPQASRTAASVRRAPPSGEPRAPISWRRMTLVVWSVGVTLALARTIGASVVVSMLVRQLRPVQDIRLQALLDRCLAEMRIRGRRPVLLVGPPDVGPALVGALRPRLLLPAEVTDGLSPAELRLVILHELAHLRRLDIPVNWLVSLLLALHWFNPLMWLVARRMRADRELACDEAVMQSASAGADGSQSSCGYGPTLLKLLESPPAPTRRPFAAVAAAAGVLGVIDPVALKRGGPPKPEAHLRRRIAMIATFDRSASARKRFGARAAALALTTLLCGVALTGAVRAQSSPDGDGKRATDTPPASGAASAKAPASPGAPGTGGKPPAGRRPAAASAGSPHEAGAGAVPPGGPMRPGGHPGAPGMPGGYPGMMRPGFGALPAGSSTPITRVDDPRAREADARAAAGLLKPMPAEFTDMSLSDALAFFTDVTGVDVFADWRNLEAAGLERNAPVTVRLKGQAPAGDVLERILQSAAGDVIGFAIDRGVVLISTQERLDRMVITRAHDIPRADDDGAAVASLIRTTVAPHTWREEGTGGFGAVTPFGGKLFVTATEPTHREVEKLLKLVTGGGGGGGASGPSARDDHADAAGHAAPGLAPMPALNVPAGMTVQVQELWTEKYAPKIIFVNDRPVNREQVEAEFRQEIDRLQHQ